MLLENRAATVNKPKSYCQNQEVMYAHHYSYNTDISYNTVISFNTDIRQIGCVDREIFCDMSSIS